MMLQMSYIAFGAGCLHESLLSSLFQSEVERAMLKHS